MAVRVVIENEASKAEDFSSRLQLKVKDAQGFAHKVDSHATSQAGGAEIDFELEPGEVKEGIFGYEVPRQDGSLMLTIEGQETKVFILLPELIWGPEPTQAPPVTPVETAAPGVVTRYQVPEEWAEARAQANLPALSGNFLDDYMLIFGECDSGIQVSCEIEKVFFLTIAEQAVSPTATP